MIVLEDEGGDGGSGGGGGSTLYERVYAECVANRTPVRKFRPQYCGSSSPEEYAAPEGQHRHHPRFPRVHACWMPICVPR